MNAFSDNVKYWDGVKMKVKRGLINTFTGPVEFPMQIKKGFVNNQGIPKKIIGGFSGIFRGVFYTLGRSFHGVQDIVTALLPNHESNVDIGIPLDAEYAWQNGMQYNVVRDGVGPIDKKLERGFYDITMFYVDACGQNMKGIHEKKIVKGFGKSFVSSLSRVVSGAFDLAGVLLPNPVTQEGVSFDEENPWESTVNSCRKIKEKREKAKKKGEDKNNTKKGRERQ
jgi:putative exosortase-associated protein (TIGR04073 family)